MSKEPKKTEYRFIKFVEFTGGWLCKNRKNEYTLGIVDYHASWKQHVFQAEGPHIIFSTDCLRDIAHFMEQLK